MHKSKKSIIFACKFGIELQNCINYGNKYLLITSNYEDWKSNFLFMKKINVEIVETDNAIIKTYKRLPIIPRIVTMLELVIVPLGLVAILSMLIHTLHQQGLTLLDRGLKLNVLLGIVILYNVWTFVSLIGVWRMRRKGMLSYLICQISRVIYSGICIAVLDLQWDSFFDGLWIIAIFLASFFFREAGHNAYTIVLNNGVIKEKKEVD